MNIDFIYFDVGGVVILDFSKTNKWNELLDDLGVQSKDKEEINKLFSKEESKYCLGETEADTFIPILKNKFKIKIPENYSFLEDFVNRFDPNPEIAKIIVDLRSKYRIGLLTNMYPKMLDSIKDKEIMPNIQWDVIIDSSKVKMQKPQPEIYELATQLAQTPVEKILFVENTKKHIEEAEKLGWNTFLYDPSDVIGSNKKLLSLL